MSPYRKGRGEELTLPLPGFGNEKWESILRDLRLEGYDIVFDGEVLRIVSFVPSDVKV